MFRLVDAMSCPGGNFSFYFVSEHSVRRFNYKRLIIFLIFYVNRTLKTRICPCSKRDFDERRRCREGVVARMMAMKPVRPLALDTVQCADEDDVSPHSTT